MSEYIKREQVLNLLENAQAWSWSMNTLYEEMQALPAEDVTPVVHGKWILDAKKPLSLFSVFIWKKYRNANWVELLPQLRSQDGFEGGLVMSYNMWK